MRKLKLIWKPKIDQPKSTVLQGLYQRSVLRPEWADKSTEIKKRDNYTCQKCSKKGVVLHVHHKYYVNGRLPWEYPDQTFVTLCNHCHSVEHHNKIPYYNESDRNLIKIEAPHIHEIELERRRNENLRREELIKERERLQQEERREQQRLKQEKRAKIKQTVIKIILLPIVGLLFLWRELGARLVYSLITAGITFWFLNDETFPTWLGLIAAGAMGTLAYIVLEKFITNSR